MDSPTCRRTSALEGNGPASSTQLQVPAWQGEGKRRGEHGAPSSASPSEQRDQSGIL